MGYNDIRPCTASNLYYKNAGLMIKLATGVGCLAKEGVLLMTQRESLFIYDLFYKLMLLHKCLRVVLTLLRSHEDTTILLTLHYEAHKGLNP